MYVDGLFLARSCHQSRCSCTCKIFPRSRWAAPFSSRCVSAANNRGLFNRNCVHFVPCPPWFFFVLPALPMFYATFSHMTARQPTGLADAHDSDIEHELSLDLGRSSGVACATIIRDHRISRSLVKYSVYWYQFAGSISRGSVAPEYMSVFICSVLTALWCCGMGRR